MEKAISSGAPIFFGPAEKVCSKLHSSLLYDLKELDLTALFHPFTLHAIKRFKYLSEHPFSEIEVIYKIQSAVKEMRQANLHSEIAQFIPQLESLSKNENSLYQRRPKLFGIFGQRRYLIEASENADAIRRLQLHRQESIYNSWESFLFNNHLILSLTLLFLEAEIANHLSEEGFNKLSKLKVVVAELSQKLKKSESVLLKQIGESLDASSFQSQGVATKFLSFYSAIIELDYLASICHFLDSHPQRTSFAQFFEDKDKVSLHIHGAHHPQWFDKARSVPMDFEMGPERKGFILSGPNGFGKTAFMESLLANTLLARMTGICLAEKLITSIFSPMTSLTPPSRGHKEMSTFMTQALALNKLIDEAKESRHALVFLDEPVAGAADSTRTAVLFTFLEELIACEIPFIVAGQDRRAQTLNPFPGVLNLYNNFNYEILEGISDEEDLSGPALKQIGLSDQLMARYRKYLSL